MPRNQFGLDLPAEMLEEYKPYKESVKMWHYCKVDVFGLVEEVRCKCCGIRVMGARSWGDPEVSHAKDQNNTLVVRQKVRIMPYDNYSMSIMKMDDESRHLTVTCKECALKLNHATPEYLKALYMCDMHSLAETATSPRDLEVVAKLHNRTPVEVI
jgi:hypothetical protein